MILSQEKQSNSTYKKILKNWDNKETPRGEGQVITHGEIGMIRREDKSCTQHIKVREVTWIDPSWLQKMPTLPPPLSQTSGCENSVNINFSCFKQPTWSWFVTLDPKNKYKIYLPSWDRCCDIMILASLPQPILRCEMNTQPLLIQVLCLQGSWLSYNFSPLPLPALIFAFTSFSFLGSGFTCHKFGLSLVTSLKLGNAQHSSRWYIWTLDWLVIAPIAKFHRQGAISQSR